MASRRLDAAIAACHDGVGSFSVTDLHDAHNSVFIGLDICIDDEDIAELAALDLGWARLVAAIRIGDPGAGAWINAAAAAHREYDAAAERGDGNAENAALERLCVISAALKEAARRGGIQP